MNVRGYPEWFIDGPWHGEDKRKKAPHLQRAIRVALPRPFNARTLFEENPFTFDEYTYIPKYVDVFGERLCVWVSEQNAGNVGRPGFESDWVRMLGQLIMAPHRSESPADVHPIARVHQQRWDIANEVRREVRQEMAELQRRNDALRRDLQRAQTFQVLEQPSIRRLEVTEKNSAILELYFNEGCHEFIHFEDIVLYFDDGDGTDENPPSWVATAQDQTGRPCTGYGTTEKSAIIALLADGLGVYARMIEIGERMK